MKKHLESQKISGTKTWNIHFENIRRISLIFEHGIGFEYGGTGGINNNMVIESESIKARDVLYT